MLYGRTNHRTNEATAGLARDVALVAEVTVVLQIPEGAPRVAKLVHEVAGRCPEEQILKRLLVHFIEVVEVGAAGPDILGEDLAGDGDQVTWPTVPMVDLPQDGRVAAVEVHHLLVGVGDLLSVHRHLQGVPA